MKKIVFVFTVFLFVFATAGCEQKEKAEPVKQESNKKLHLAPVLERKTKLPLVGLQVFNPEQTKIGDKVASLKITKMGFPSEKGENGKNYCIVTFSGSALVSGVLSFEESLLVFRPSESSISQLPISFDDERVNQFQFTNAQKLIETTKIKPGEKKEIAILISQYLYNFNPGSMNFAEFQSIVSDKALIAEINEKVNYETIGKMKRAANPADPIVWEMDSQDALRVYLYAHKKWNIPTMYQMTRDVKDMKSFSEEKFREKEAFYTKPIEEIKGDDQVKVVSFKGEEKTLRIQRNEQGLWKISY